MVAEVGRYALTPVMTTSKGMEYSVHTCPRQYKSDLEAIFPGVRVMDLLIIPTCQNSEVDLVRTGEVIEEEKDRLLEIFVDFAKQVCELLISQGHWADYLDPASGLPMIHKDTNTVYSEVDALSTLLHYTCQNAGCCKVILHPKWGSSVYPATLFAKAPLEVVLEAINKVDEQTSKPATRIP
ncbi:hypothetical protein KFL_004540080 [Klebsormidium nitens]|uniref:Methylmalonic aciduria and homocystinuria type D protein n=1 Tax=Klebsormidium nitens TaxID=105231 RepID=A0A1Y1IDR6_KLENI|nr:hypothetical protein KFL_004540080 [Klebsormidium nitens]|eukprot:GAQ88723.1 hypothetical protein KFL_004540080 [Klebsormidium nitens]